MKSFSEETLAKSDSSSTKNVPPGQSTMQNIRDSVIGIPGFLSNIIDTALIPDNIESSTSPKSKSNEQRPFFDLQKFNPLDSLGSASGTDFDSSRNRNSSSSLLVNSTSPPLRKSPSLREISSEENEGSLLNIMWESEPGQIARCVFCLGNICKSCSKEALKHCSNPAIPGMNSNWITDSIVAMQRPLKKSHFDNPDHPLMKSFQELGITAIINCTEIGEHPYCGDGILESTGLSYDPEEAMAAGVEYYHFGWEDMTVPSVDSMLDIVRVGNSVIERGGKVAVHCHAGFGRTGIVIACMIISRENVSAQEAITLVRSKRGKCIQTKLQESFVNQYYEKYRTLNMIFRTPSYQISLSETLTAQRYVLNEPEAKFLKNVPKVIFLTIHSLLQKLRNGTNEEALDVANSFLGKSLSSSSKNAPWSVQHEHIITTMINSANEGSWRGWPKIKESLCDDIGTTDYLNKKDVFENTDHFLTEDPRFATSLLYEFLSQLKEPILPYGIIDQDIKEKVPLDTETIHKQSYTMSNELLQKITDPKIGGTISLLYKLVDAFVHHHALDSHITKDIYDRTGIILTNLQNFNGSKGYLRKGKDLFLYEQNKDLEEKMKLLLKPDDLNYIKSLEETMKRCSKFAELTSTMKYPTLPRIEESSIKSKETLSNPKFEKRSSASKMAVGAL